MEKMKTKNKVVALLGIAIVLCSVFLVTTSPGIAADQNQEMQKVSVTEVTTTSEDDFVLGIYGNANEDNTIDMRDLTYVKLIFFGKKTKTELADAKYDGKINPLDFVQIKLIIVGKEKELTVVDSADKIVTLNKPIERIIVSGGNHAEAIMILKAVDKVVGVGDWITTQGILYPELSKLPSVGGFCSGYNEPDIEAIFELEPDILFTYATHTPELDEKLGAVGMPILCLDFCDPINYTEEIEKLGYISNRREEAQEYIDFCNECMNQILEKTESLPEEDKPRVYYETSDYHTANTRTPFGVMISLAGGINIAADLEEKPPWSGYPEVDPEWVIEQDPEIILKSAYYEAGYDIDDPTGIKAAREAVLSRPELAHVSAIKNKAVYMNTFGLFGTYYYVSVAYMAKWFHPDLCEDLDPQAIHQEYLTRFAGLDYDLDEHGVFVYPPLED